MPPTGNTGQTLPTGVRPGAEPRDQVGEHRPQQLALGIPDDAVVARHLGHHVAVQCQPQLARDHRRLPPQAAVGDDYAYRRRASERTQEVQIRDVRAIMGAANQRCWVERQAVPAANPNANVGGAVLGAVVGGILGHQVGGGSGRDAATGVGAVAGVALVYWIGVRQEAASGEAAYRT